MTLHDTEVKSRGSSLVSSNDVNGQYVYARNGEHIGTIDHLMIDKVSGKVAYAVMTFGGFLGVGEEEHPVPWQKLSYDPSKGGFVTDISEDDVRGAPERSDTWIEDRDFEDRMHRHYGTAPYWA